MSAADQPLWRRLLWRRLRAIIALLVVLALVVGGVYLLAPQWIVKGVHWERANKAGLTSHEADIDGQHWAWYAGGEGPTIVLLPGLGGDRHNWVPVAGQLTRNFHVVVPDLPGWGDSVPLAGEDVGPRAQAGRLAVFLGRVAPGQVVLIGHSEGGLIAALYNDQHARHVAGLGLVDSFGADHLATAVRDGDPFAYTDRAGFRRLLGLAFAEPPQLPGRIVDVYVKRNRARLDQVKQVFRQLRAPRQAKALARVLPDVAKPVLVVWCRNDQITDSKAAATITGHLDASTRIDSQTLFGCSHMPMLEQPEAVARAISHFILPVRHAVPNMAQPAAGSSTAG